MAYVLGIDIGGTHVTAAVGVLADGTWKRPTPVRLRGDSDEAPAVLHVDPEGALQVGDPAERGPVLRPGVVAREFAGRIGADAPVLLRGERWSPQTLTAIVARRVTDLVHDREGRPPARVVVAHPATFTAHHVSALRAALADVGLAAEPLPEPVLAAEGHAARGGTGARALAVLTIGGTGFEASVVTRTNPITYAVRATRTGAEQIGGADLDEALAHHAYDALRPEIGPLATDAERHLRILHDLRAESRYTREQLSHAGEAEIILPLHPGEIRLTVTRDQLATLLRPLLDHPAATLARAVAASGVPPHHLGGVLLAGGTAHTPLLAELCAAHLPGVTILPPGGATLVAEGAAAVAAQLAAGLHDAPPDTGRRGTAVWEPEPGQEPSVLPAPASDGRAHTPDAPPRPPVRISTPDLPGRRRTRRAQGMNASAAALVLAVGAFAPGIPIG
ncbi:molecular chaperone DnaK (HSP70) [Catenuloplanes nepalensis]|uniref:Molecular chaperone DnaK (HSP70) n=1 Tax=Catenuloplanes nepalensis TaxID=587533 RepID=A0ABT9N897_9ACTN|nr:Hsp70 family protein [Catenuloplanes nepalensis]MDP9799621.1 molecular chaperone DnaK (HSP70) [Catenuloplanes nepalensis]